MVENSSKTNLDELRRKGVPNQTLHTTRIQYQIYQNEITNIVLTENANKIV